LEIRVLGGKEVHKALQDGGIHIPVTGLEKYDPVKALVELASPGPSSLPRRASQGKNGSETDKEAGVDGNRPVVTGERKGSNVPAGKVAGKNRRWLRRRYRELLAEVPSITLATCPPRSALNYKVAWASPDLAMAHTVPRPLRLATPDEMEWITKAEIER
jgi:hypothetical protein